MDGFTTNALRGPDRISPFLVPMGIPNVGAGQIAIQFGMTGPNFTTVSACATGGHAIGEASEIIRRGDADVMIAGGAEAAIFEAMVGGFAAMRALSTRNDDPERRIAAVRHRARRLRHRRGRRRGRSSRRSSTREARGAEILAELVGLRRDRRRVAHHAARRPAASARSGRRAGRSRRPASTPADIDHVNAHATSTPEGDKAELQAIRTIFGDDAGAGGDHGQQVDARSHARRRRRDRGDHDDPVDPRGLHPADDQPDRSGSRGAGLDLTPNVAATPRDPVGPEQLVRLWRPEHGARVQPVDGVTDAARPADGPDAVGLPPDRTASSSR